MPKKFIGENTKAVAAKQKKQKAKKEAELKKNLEIEEERWRDVSNLLEKRLKKQEEEEKKRQEHLKRKAELKVLLQKETESVAKTKTNNIQKFTRAQIYTNTKKTVTKNKVEANKPEAHIINPLTENFNRLSLNEETARTINEAISMLNDKNVEDRHPEKRLKAAHKAFEEKRLKELKIANPTLKLSQLKQMVFKEWQKLQGELP